MLKLGAPILSAVKNLSISHSWLLHIQLRGELRLNTRFVHILVFSQSWIVWCYLLLEKIHVVRTHRVQFMLFKSQLYCIKRCLNGKNYELGKFGAVIQAQFFELLFTLHVFYAILQHTCPWNDFFKKSRCCGCKVWWLSHMCTYFRNTSFHSQWNVLCASLTWSFIFRRLNNRWKTVQSPPACGPK